MIFIISQFFKARTVQLNNDFFLVRSPYFPFSPWKWNNNDLIRIFLSLFFLVWQSRVFTILYSSKFNEFLLKLALLVWWRMIQVLSFPRSTWRQNPWQLPTDRQNMKILSSMQAICIVLVKLVLLTLYSNYVSNEKKIFCSYHTTGYLKNH